MEDEIFDLWAERKIEFLNNIIARYGKDKVTDIETNINNDFELEIALEKEELFTSKDRKKSLLQFKNSGNMIFFESIDYSYYMHSDIERMIDLMIGECKILIEYLENRNIANDNKVFFDFIDASIDYIVNYVSWYDGRVSVICEQKEARSGCGKGQQEAQKRRIEMLANNLKGYPSSNNEIRITKNCFLGLMNKTFEGRENYPRPSQTFKTYQKGVEEILNLKIVFIGR
ncbi:MAG: hypothetical protein KBA28_11235 [Syntrophaceae bacterium]|jgi:hypothetical protein|nr:hypothetical protein [Syntrophaceae bacterium]